MQVTSDTYIQEQKNNKAEKRSLDTYLFWCSISDEQKLPGQQLQNTILLFDFAKFSEESSSLQKRKINFTKQQENSPPFYSIANEDPLVDIKQR